MRRARASSAGPGVSMLQDVKTVIAVSRLLPRATGVAALATAALMLPAASASADASAAPGTPTAAAGQTSPLAPGLPLTDYQRGYGTWAYTAVPGVPIRQLPRSDSRQIARLRSLTEDGLAEVYEVLGETVDAHANTWVHIMVPMRPNGRTGWVPAKDLGPFHLVRAVLVINRPTRTLTLFKNGRVAFRTRIGVGKPSTPTPGGHFWIREKFPVSGVPLYGPFAIGTSNYSAVETDWPGGGVVGIHGTDQPRLIPGAPSHGCIRLRNAAIARLYPMVSVGTPLIIV